MPMKTLREKHVLFSQVKLPLSDLKEKIIFISVEEVTVKSIFSNQAIKSRMHCICSLNIFQPIPKPLNTKRHSRIAIKLTLFDRPN